MQFFGGEEKMKVFVTGGHGGIGSAVCEKFAREGYEVTAPGSKELDLSDLAAVKNYFAARDGRFDAVVHCAGYNPPLSVEDTTIEEFDRTQNINLTSLLEITRAVAPYMKEQKRGRTQWLKKRRRFRMLVIKWC